MAGPEIMYEQDVTSQSQWPRGPTHGSVAACLLGLRVRIPPRAWIYVVIVALSGRGLCDSHSSRGVLPSVVCPSVIEEPPRGCLGALQQSSNEKYIYTLYPRKIR